MAAGWVMAFSLLVSAVARSEPKPLWAPAGIADDPDSFVCFRGQFSTKQSGATMRVVGASEYLVWLDGKLVHDGPARYAKQYPEYQTVFLDTKPGKHILAVQVRNNGVTTRILSDVKPFLWLGLTSGGGDVELPWKCARMPGQRSRAGRISDILGWTDWFDTRQSWKDWQEAAFDDSRWLQPTVVDPGVGEIRPCLVRPVNNTVRFIKPLAKGEFAQTYGYEQDDSSARFFLDDLAPHGMPPQGVWRRYDLGRVRLGRLNITLDCPAGAVVEIASSEQLSHGRVAPWITLSGSRTSNLDHFVARGGRQTFMPFTPKGGRYVEVHVRTTAPVKFLKEEFLERSSFGEPVGSFACGDQLLERIWKTGVETVRACADDAMVDCPTRERGQWTGDVASVSTDIVAVAYGDFSLARRALVQAAQSARADGLVAGVGPGDPGYLSTYAAQWATACVHYWELSGDKSLLTELYQAARSNIAAFDKHTTSAGVDGGLGWGFVDWGYMSDSGPSDMALNLHYLECLKAMVRWDKALDHDDEATADEKRLTQLQSAVSAWLKSRTAEPGGWSNVNYHCSVLALHAGLVPDKEVKECVERIKRHLSACFPNNPLGPPLSDPGVQEPMVITPYFGHWALATLMEHGEADFALDQYRKCWGWMLKGGYTTWLEVFDTRWSHCHEWSGCPTWQLSRYILGIRPRMDLGWDVVEFNPVACRLLKASGTVPLPGGRILRVEWKRDGQNLVVTFKNGAGTIVNTSAVLGQALKVPYQLLASGR